MDSRASRFDLVHDKFLLVDGQLPPAMDATLVVSKNVANARHYSSGISI